MVTGSLREVDRMAPPLFNLISTLAILCQITNNKIDLIINCVLACDKIIINIKSDIELSVTDFGRIDSPTDISGTCPCPFYC